MKEISLEEQKEICLDMLNKIHMFCQEKGIKYSLACGTLLGAIRHKGYIPWDDDVDIMMPLPDMLRLKNEFQSREYYYMDSSTAPKFCYPFARIVNRSTYYKIGRTPKGPGIGIDIYPIIPIPNTISPQVSFFDSVEKLERRILFLSKWYARFSRLFGFSFMPGLEKLIKQQYDLIICDRPDYDKSKSFYITSGPVKERQFCIYNRDLFSQLVLMPFENLQLNVISDYTSYLEQTYGNYLELPPEESRIPHHFNHYYWY